MLSYLDVALIWDLNCGHRMEGRDRSTGLKDILNDPDVAFVYITSSVAQLRGSYTN